MNVLVSGVGVENKGAFLMLKAIQQEMTGNARGKVKLFFRPTKAFGKAYVISEGLHPLPKLRARGFNFEDLAALIPRSLRHAMGLYLRKDMDVYMDASGFIFGDQWDSRTIKNWFLDDVEYFHERKRKIVFLPQAFGPFKKPDVKEICERVLQKANLVLVRDSVSFDHIGNLSLNGTAIRQFPDFTNLISPAKDDFLNNGNAIAIVPNQKLIESGKITRPDYVNFIVQLATDINKHGKSVAFINHAGNKDLELAKEIVGKLNFKADIITEFDPVRLKQIIGSFAGVISGRFHAVVSALSQNVPCIATSWSHKYQMLLAEYGVGDYLIPLNADAAISREKLSLILDPLQTAQAVAILKEKNKILKASTAQMWREVRAVIDRDK